MTGEKQIIAARLKGFRPAAVFIEAGLPPMPVLSKYDDPEKAMAHGNFPTVNVTPDELGKRLDLRFLTGLRVHIHAAEMSDKVVDLVDAVASVASHVVVLAGHEMMEYKNENWEVWA